MSDLTIKLDSQNHWLADGVQTVWNFEFSGGYINRSHVRAYYEDNTDPENPVRTDLVINPDTDFVGDYQLLVTPAAPALSTMVIYRATPRDLPLVDFQDGGGVTELNLDTTARQAVFLAQESADYLGVTTTADLQELALESLANAGAAAASAATATSAAATATAAATSASSSAVAAAVSAAYAESFASGVGSGIGYRHPTIPGAVQQTLQDLGGRCVSAFDVIPKSQWAAIMAGTSVYDATAVLQTALNTGKVITVPSGAKIVALNLTSGAAGGGLVCLDGRATIQVPAGVGYAGLLITHNNWTLRGINFEGGNLGPWNVATPPTSGGRVGVIVGNPFGTGAQVFGITVADCDITGFDGTGFEGREVQIGFEFGKRAVIHNVNCHDNYVNWNYGTRFEYTTTTHCYGWNGYIGIVVAGGNNTVSASHYEWNYFNHQLNAGENNAHGQFLACSFNHAIGWGLAADSITAGHVYSGCAFWYSPIRLVNCTGIIVRDSQIAGNPIVTIDGGGVNSIDDNYTPDGLIKTFTGFTFTTFRNNRVALADNTPGSHYRSVDMRGTGNGMFAYPIPWASTSYFTFNVDYTVKKYNGEDAAFLVTGGNAIIPTPGYYTITAAFRFNNLTAAEQAKLKLEVIRGGSPVADLTTIAAETATISEQDCCVRLTTRAFLLPADTVRFQLKTLTVTGFSIPTDGVDIQIYSDR